MDFKKRLFFIGLRACGKTTVGKAVADKLNVAFYDLDDFIVQRAGKSIKEIVYEAGWDKFRSLERDALEYFFSLSPPFILACGGGAVLHKDTWSQRRSKDDVVIWLDASIDEMVKRILNDSKSGEQRPCLKDGLSLKDEIKKVRQERFSLYKELADIVIVTDSLDIKKIRDKVLESIL